ncbi:UNVERIFIED_CONTAM: WYL domain-containing protein, partial [Lactobacillus paragasseri]|nr:WYL domain-containing protein [Lactobacillus paragasseri]
YPYLGKPINLEILYSYDPQFVLDRFPEAIVDWKNVRDRPFIKNPYARKVYHITIPVNDGFGVRMWLQGQGDLVKVLAPKHIRDYVVRVLRKSLKNYQNEDDTGKYL